MISKMLGECYLGSMLIKKLEESSVPEVGLLFISRSGLLMIQGAKQYNYGLRYIELCRGNSVREYGGGSVLLEILSCLLI